MTEEYSTPPGSEEIEVSQAQIENRYWMLLMPPSIREEVGGDFLELYQEQKRVGKSFIRIHLTMLAELVALWISLTLTKLFRP